MSGPIVRKYGFPNFDNIFGKRELEHGVDEPNEAETAAPATAGPADKASEKKPKAPSKSKKKS